jgi:hypothetical protein
MKIFHGGMLGLCLAALLVSGCAKPEEQILGTWKGPSSSITFQKDKKFSETGGPDIEGFWVFASDTCVLSTKTIDGKDIAKSLVRKRGSPLPSKKQLAKTAEIAASLSRTATLSDGGKTLTIKDSKGQTQTFQKP